MPLLSRAKIPYLQTPPMLSAFNDVGRNGKLSRLTMRSRTLLFSPPSGANNNEPRTSISAVMRACGVCGSSSSAPMIIWCKPVLSGKYKSLRLSDMALMLKPPSDTAMLVVKPRPPRY